MYSTDLFYDHVRRFVGSTNGRLSDESTICLLDELSITRLSSFEKKNTFDIFGEVSSSMLTDNFNRIKIYMYYLSSWIYS